MAWSPNLMDQKMLFALAWNLLAALVDTLFHVKKVKKKGGAGRIFGKNKTADQKWRTSTIFFFLFFLLSLFRFVFGFLSRFFDYFLS